MISPGPGIQPLPVLPAPSEELIIPRSGRILQPPVERMTIDQFAALPAAAQTSLRRFHRRTRLQRTDVTLAAGVAQQLVGNNPDRISVSLSNTGVTNPFTVTQDGDKTVTQGDVMGANGSAFSTIAIEDGEAPAATFFGISTAGTTVHINEIIAYGPFVVLPDEVSALST